MSRSLPPILQRLKELNLPVAHHAVFGSAPLLVRGIIDHVNDLDVICRGPAWERSLEVGTLTRLEQYGIDVVEVDEGAITMGTSWAYGDFDLDDLIDTAELIDGIPFVRLEHVVAYKRIAGRPKDLDHLAAMVAGGLLRAEDGRD